MWFSFYWIFLGTNLALFARGSGSLALLAGHHRFVKRVERISWTPCKENSERECGRLEVPLDYQNGAAGTASLAVARYRATSSRRLGTLFINPGGPGGSGVDMILNKAESIKETVDGRYDLVSWDPRGVGDTTPKLHCFKTSEQEYKFWRNSIPYSGIEAKGNFTDVDDLRSFYDQLSMVDRLLKKIGERCNLISPNTLQYLGTMATVRDLVALSDSIQGPDQPINFWGFSYGTVIGIYFVNVFPKRVGRVVLDGVIDPEIWANHPAHELWNRTIHSVDAAMSEFVTSCAGVGPSRCAIASNNSSPDSIRREVLKLIDRAYEFGKNNGPDAEITSAYVRGKLYSGLCYPRRWTKLARLLRNIRGKMDNETLTSHSHEEAETTDSDSADPDKPKINYVFHAVACADAADTKNTTTKMVFDSLVESTRTTSSVFGQLWNEAGLYCHNWPVRAVERFTGPFNETLQNKIIIIGNQADASTPLLSARRVADALGESAVLIEQSGVGHSSTALYSQCTRKALNKYFRRGTLPARGLICQPDEVLFSVGSTTAPTPRVTGLSQKVN